MVIRASVSLLPGGMLWNYAHNTPARASGCRCPWIVRGRTRWRISGSYLSMLSLLRLHRIKAWGCCLRIQLAHFFMAMSLRQDFISYVPILYTVRAVLEGRR